MGTNVIDLIVYLVNRMKAGDTLGDIKLESPNVYNRAEISAAYSWVIQKRESGELESIIRRDKHSHTYLPPRILHFAERMVISPGAYGFLLELLNLGLIDYATLEKIIEAVMLNATERVSLDKIKETVSGIILSADDKTHRNSQFLKGNESIN